LQKINSERERAANLYKDKMNELRHAKSLYNNKNNELVRLREKYENIIGQYDFMDFL